MNVMSLHSFTSLHMNAKSTHLRHLNYVSLFGGLESPISLLTCMALDCDLRPNLL
uniref:Uncharacterized protein n=1 Tax=Anguilla anguilla TaxID=7936 RepID=A0A0E9TLH3_ANGAN